MPVTISRNVYIKDKEGKVLILTETDQISEDTDISAVCDSSRCASRHDGKTVEIAWNIEAVKAKPEALPDSFFRLLSLIVDPKTQGQKVFCSAGCVRDYLQYDYVAPLSPREEAILLANNEQAEIAKHRPKTNIVQFPVKPAATVEAPPAPAVADTPIDTIEEPRPEPNAGLQPLDEVPPVTTQDPVDELLNGPDGVQGPDFLPREGA